MRKLKIVLKENTSKVKQEFNLMKYCGIFSINKKSLIFF